MIDLPLISCKKEAGFGSINLTPRAFMYAQLGHVL
jgi:hypothetical protein